MSNCNSLFSSFLNHGITSWGLSYETHQKHLFLLQKKVLRCISFQPYCFPSLPIFHSLKVLTLKDPIHFNILNFVYKSINKFTPPVFHNFFQLSQNVHLYGTRQASRGDLFQTSENTIQYGLRSKCSTLVQNYGNPFQFMLELPHRFPFSNLNRKNF